MSLSQKRWRDPAPAPVEETAALAKALDILPATARILFNRGIEDAASGREFLHPSLEQLPSPWLMKGMERAVARIGTALEKGEKIVVYGDYDVDGITAAALLIETLRQLGAAADFYLPSRFREGYGLHREALEEISAAGGDLVITVDCGMNAAAEGACARSLGLDLIITDHHQPLEETGAAVILNPLQEGCRYPFKDLAGVGIAFKLAAALLERAGGPFPEHLLELAALGTVADLVPLRGENRVLTACGIERMRRSPRPGLQALAEAGGVEPEQIDSYVLAFILAPPLNAAGRLGEADPALHLLLEQNEAEAGRLASALHQTNRQRRDTGARILQEAEAALTADRRGAGEHIITLAGADWPHGVIGIVASRLAERFYRPVVLIGLDGAEGRGSARSIPGFNITAALDSCAPLLDRFGGHEQAAGLTIKAAHIDELREQLNRYAAPRLQPEQLSPLIEIDAALTPPEIGLGLARELTLLEPFGRGNPRPLFCSRGWELHSWRLVGAERSHLKLELARGGHRAAPIFFSAAALEPSLERDRPLDLVFTLREGRFNDRPVLDMVLQDLRRGESAADGRVAVIDRRGERNRLAALKQILSAGGDAPAIIFTGTKRRQAALEQQLPASPTLAFLSSGRDNYERGLAAPPEGWRQLILYDLPLSGKMLEPFFKSCPGGGTVKIHLLYSEADGKRNDLLLGAALPSRSALETLYRAWAEAAAAGESEFPGKLPEKLALPGGKNFWERSRKIFAEAGLARGGAPLPPKDFSNLEQLFDSSPLFRAAQERREGCLRYQEYLLESSPEELAVFWEKQLGRPGRGGAGGAKTHPALK